MCVFIYSEFLSIETDDGHDGFLTQAHVLKPRLQAFLRQVVETQQARA